MVAKSCKTQKGANKHGPSCSVPTFTRWTVTIVTRVLWPAPVSPLLTPQQLYLFILRTLLSIALKQSWCSTVPSSAEWGTALTHYHHYRHATVATLWYDESLNVIIRRRSAADNQPNVMPANVLMHDDDGRGPTFDPFNFSHERREITPAFWWQINMNMMIIWALDTAIPLSMIEFLLAQQ